MPMEYLYKILKCPAVNTKTEFDKNMVRNFEKYGTRTHRSIDKMNYMLFAHTCAKLAFDRGIQRDYLFTIRDFSSSKICREFYSDEAMERSDLNSLLVDDKLELAEFIRRVVFKANRKPELREKFLQPLLERYGPVDTYLKDILEHWFVKL